MFFYVFFVNKLRKTGKKPQTDHFFVSKNSIILLTYRLHFFKMCFLVMVFLSFCVFLGVMALKILRTKFYLSLEIQGDYAKLHSIFYYKNNKVQQ